MWHIHIIQLKRDEILMHATARMSPAKIMLDEISQIHKGTNMMPPIEG